MRSQMQDVLVKIGIAVWIGLGALGLSLHALRVFRPAPESSYSRRHGLRRRSFIRECFHLIIGVAALALYRLGVLGGWWVLAFGGVTAILLEYALLLLVKPRSEAGG
jgi:hypothetical protein